MSASVKCESFRHFFSPTLPVSFTALKNFKVHFCRNTFSELYDGLQSYEKYFEET